MLVLFGSAARGDDRPSSDVDLLIDGPIADDVRARSRLRGQLVEALGRPVDLVTLAEGAVAPAMLVGALMDGRPLKDRAGGWTRLVAEAPRIRAEADAERATYAAREAAALSSLIGSGRTSEGARARVRAC